MFHETIQVVDVVLLILAAVALGASGWKFQHKNHTTTMKVVKRPSALKPAKSIAVPKRHLSA